jgi:hypothetical protein
MEVLRITRRPFCSFGYLPVLLNARGDIPEMQGFCDGIDFKSNVEIGEVEMPASGNEWKKTRMVKALH